MKRKHFILLILLVTVALVLFPVIGTSQDQAKPAQKKPVQQVQAEEQEPYTEEEYDAYDKAVKEPDLDKRATMLFAFIDKYPKSKLMPYIDQAYGTLAYDYKTREKWDKLEPLAEQWLKLHPNDLPTIVYIAQSAQKLGHDQKFVEYGEKIYAAKPDGDTAYFIAQAYKRLGNQPKYLEWTEKLFSFPQFDGEFGLRLLFMEKYANEKNLEKAAEYARLALKSIDAAKKPDSVPEAKWNEDITKTRKGCDITIGLNYYEKQKWADAIKYLAEANKVQKSAEAYYYIGHCQWKTGQIDAAMISFAAAELSKGDVSAKAKEYLEQLYKSIHNDTLIGIEKTYNKARKELSG